MKNIDSYTHVRGESIYVDDIEPIEGTLYAAVFSSPIASGKILELNIDEASQSEGVFCIITADDIPGENQIGRIIPDEVLFTKDKVDFIGQPIALVLAKTEIQAKDACSKIHISIEPNKVIVDPREAFSNDLLIMPPKYSIHGDVDKAWEKCEVIAEGTVEIGGQEHLYLETQGSYAYPVENSGIMVLSSTQGPTGVQSTIARILGIPMHKVEVDVRRLGGGFGGKEDQATAWACMAGLGAYLTNKPVKLILDRMDDLKMTGKRHPYSADYKIGLTKEGKILAYEVVLYQNAGAAADLSPPVLGRTMFHVTNAYYIPNVKITGISCKTNIPPNTAFRGFGGPQGKFIIEAALDHAANLIKKDKWEIQKLNLLKDGDSFHFGQIAHNTNSLKTWQEAETKYNTNELIHKIEEFNSQNNQYKKGFAFMPICFGISFTKSMLNQAGALVNIYFDGSVGVSTGAVEMGQGVNTRILQVPLRVFSISKNKIKIETTNTTRVINTSPSAASATHDLNGKATEIACNKLMKRLLRVAAKHFKIKDIEKFKIKNGIIFLDDRPTELTWEKLVNLVYTNRVDLSAHGYYATPEIHFNPETQKGHPFAYHVYGTAFFEVTVDCIRGTYEFDSVKIIHDTGRTMNSIIDLGQIEGGLVQGIGWMTSEEVLWNDKGELLSNTLSNYKVPDIFAVPKKIETNFLENNENPLGLFRSKAVGEPPFMYCIGAYFAIKNAIKEFNPNTKLKYSPPITPEKTLLSLYDYQIR